MIVPIDRAYTLKFFGIPQSALQIRNDGDEEKVTWEVFSYIYPHLVYIAKNKKVARLINTKRDHPYDWDTSYTKIIDNAIIGAIKLGEYKQIGEIG